MGFETFQKDSSSSEKLPLVESETKIDVIAEAIEEAILEGEGIELPTLGTPAYERLLLYAKEYSHEVKLEVTKKSGNISFSGKLRRSYHNALCIALLGKEYDIVRAENPDNIQKIANFAHIISGNEQFLRDPSS